MTFATTRDRGLFAERLAAAYLEERGYRIVTRNFRIRTGEIDLICRDADVLCFVEVRSRSNAAHGSPEETISRVKRRRIARAAAHYLARIGEEPTCRFDVVAVDGDGVVRLIQDAFRLEDC